MVLGRDDPHDYVEKTPQFGATVGRFANRIAGGRFTLDGVAYDLPRNEAGRTHLHGGAAGSRAATGPSRRWGRAA